MNQTSVHGIMSDTPVSLLSNDDLEYLWSQMVRQRKSEDTNSLIRGEREPFSDSERQLVRVAEEMVKRDLFSSFCLVGP
jgi:hypothetical protein